MTNEHPMDVAYRNGAARIPDDLRATLAETTNDSRFAGWPEFVDAEGEVWALTDETHNGEAVLLPSAGDMHPMLLSDVEREFGPLVASSDRNGPTLVNRKA